MKNSLFRLATVGIATAAISACASIDPHIKYSESSVSYQKLIFTTSADCGIKTKTERQSDGKVFWNPGDEISIFYGSGTAGGSKFTSTNTETTAIANFTGEIGVITGGGEIPIEETYFWGIYPYRDDNECDGTSVTITLPANQDGVADSFADNLFPTMGCNRGLSLAFYNIGGGMRFSVTRDDIKRVTLRGNNGETLAGRVKVEFINGEPTVTDVIDAETEITLTAPDGGCFEVGRYYYLVTLPVVFSKGMTFTMIADTQKGTIERTSQMQIKRSVFGGFADADTKTTFIDAIDFKDAGFKAYCVDHFDTDGNGEICVEETIPVTSIDVSGMKSGIRLINSDLRRFQSLLVLDCSDMDLTELDVTGLPTGYLICNNNKLASIDLTNTPNLETLLCSNNEITSLDLSKNSSLSSLYCSNNKLTELSFNKDASINQLECANNKLTSLDLTNMLDFRYLDASNNNLQVLSFPTSSWEGLSIICSNNKLTSLDLSMATALYELKCDGNLIQSLDISSNNNLHDLDCSPMKNAAGQNVLQTLIMAPGQTIDNINSKDAPRNSEYVPNETNIIVKGESGGSEGTDTEDWG